MDVARRWRGRGGDDPFNRETFGEGFADSGPLAGVGLRLDRGDGDGTAETRAVS